MKRLLLCAGVLLAASTLFAQGPPPGPQKSPEVKAEGKIGSVSLTIDYCSPRVNGRAGKLFGADGRIAKDPTYPVWRAGANTSTLLTTDGDLKIGSLLVPKGTYTLYVDISNPAAWVLIVNKQTGQWGTKYDKTQDLGRVPMKTVAPPALVEEMTYTISAEGTLTLAWENVTASVPVEAVM